MPVPALLHLPTWADRRRTFERVAGSLRPGGRFAWNAFAFDHLIVCRLDGQHQDEPLPHTIRYAVGDNRIDIRLDDGATSSLWWATKNEWLGLLEVAGLELEALFGGFDRGPLDDESREYVFVACRDIPEPGPVHGASPEDIEEKRVHECEASAAWRSRQQSTRAEYPSSRPTGSGEPAR